MNDAKVLQLDNTFLQEEWQKNQQLQAENRRKNRFMGWMMVLVMCLFILPTYNLVESYQQLQKKEQQLKELHARYEELVEVEQIESSLVTKLKDEDYAAKYIRAKYQYSKENEFIYNIPGLLPK